MSVNSLIFYTNWLGVADMRWIDGRLSLDFNCICGLGRFVWAREAFVSMSLCKFRLWLCNEPYYYGRVHRSVVDIAAIAAAISLQRPLKHLYCGCRMLFIIITFTCHVHVHECKL